MSAVQHIKILAGLTCNLDVYLLDIFPSSTQSKLHFNFAKKLYHLLTTSIVNLRLNHNCKGESNQSETVALLVVAFNLDSLLKKKLVSVREALRT